MSTRFFGQSVRRNEDELLLRGRGSYFDDVSIPDALHVAFLRSTNAHARITRLETSRALAHPGVFAVFTHADLGDLDKPLPLLFPHPSLAHPRTQHPLARTEVNYVGETIAMIVAESRYVAEDALELIEIEEEPLPATVDLEASASPGAPRVHADTPGNVAATVTQSVGDVDEAFERADIVFRERLVLDRAAAMPMETRGVAARFEPKSGKLTVWDTTQAALPVRGGLVSALGIPEDKVEVIVPDTGGGFGVKAFFFYPEEILIPWAAVTLCRAVKWVEDRAESFVGSNHERRQVHNIEVAASTDGVVLAIRDRFLHDTGAYIPYGLTTPMVSASQIAGPYRVPNIEVEFSAVYTNTVPVSPYRGAGRPHACFAIERALDRLAATTEIDRAELRRRNLVTEFPHSREGLIFVDGVDVTLDSGDYLRQLDMLLEAIGYQEFRAEQEVARDDGRHLGLGLACYVEATGMGPYEGAHVHVHGTTGEIHVATGLTTQGQSHKTTFAQIAADELGVDPDRILVTTGQTARFPWGAGTYGSRAIVACGNAIAISARAVREKALRLAAGMLEVAVDDLELDDGVVFVSGAPERSVSLKQVAMAANPMRYAFDPEVAALARFGPARPPDGPLLPEDDGPGLEAIRYSSQSQATWASGAHAAVVEVDPETGRVEFRRYAAVHDCGRVVNPMVVDGQVMGGIAQGVGGSLYERIVYDDGGQLRNASFMDFLIPYATEIPPMTLEHLETPSPLNPLGIKGAGEAGVIPAAAVAASAIENALSGTGVSITEMPLEPASLYALISSVPRAG